MKTAPRLDFQLPRDIHLWGYAADKTDVTRFEKMKKNYPLLKQRSPLIERGMTKKDTHKLLAKLGVKRPVVYDLGMPNGNCLCCVKSSSKAYWALMRKEFPAAFEKRNEQCRRFGARLVILRTEKLANGKRKNIRGFPDEVPEDQSTKVKAADFGGCGFDCSAT